MNARSSIKLCLYGSLLLLLLVGNTGYAKSEQPNFYQESKEGWFWYHDPQLLPEEEREQPEPNKLSPQTFPRNVSLQKYSTETLWNMHPDDFQQLLNTLQKKAVQYPTEQNILEYLSIQDIARRKALAYANAAQFVTQKRSDIFSINQVYPTSTPGVSARIEQQQNEIVMTIAGARENHALLFFEAPGCSFCDQQAQILSHFIDKYGWQIKPINIKAQPDLALHFNITVTPTLLLIKEDQKQSMPIATGVVTLPEIERKLYQTIRYLRGDTTPDTFTTYDFQKGSALDPGSILKEQQPWKDRKETQGEAR